MSLTLLVVDDAPAVRTLLRDYLEAQGYTILTATDGAEALEIAGSSKSWRSRTGV